MKSTTNTLKWNSGAAANQFICDWQKFGLPDRLRIRQSLLPARQDVTRAYLRELRAAEMTAWEITGGDYLISR
ncbi:MAG TPA: hypothetical protein VN281_22945 [Verrucomicrobiae bacterium]|nr:hypothetical protein [Verrucomicrobiae bacterium]